MVEKYSSEGSEDKKDQNNQASEMEKFNGISRRKAVGTLASTIAMASVGSQISTATYRSQNSDPIRCNEEYQTNCGGGGGYDPDFTTGKNQRIVNYWGTDNDPYNDPNGSFIGTSQGLVVERIDSAEIAGEVQHVFSLSTVVSTEAAITPGEPWDEQNNFDWEEFADIDGVYLEIENDQSSSTSSLITPDPGDKRLVAAAQGSGDSGIDWQDGITEAAGVAVTELNTVANILISSYNVVNAFKNDGEGMGNGQHADYWWDYTNSFWDPNDTKSNTGASVRFNVSANNPSDGYDITVGTDVEWKKPFDKDDAVSEAHDPHIEIDISSNVDVTSEQTISIKEVENEYFNKKARDEGVSEITKLSYNDKVR